MAIATAPRSRTSAALAPVRRAFAVIAAALTTCIEIYQEAMARRRDYFERHPHLSQE